MENSGQISNNLETSLLLSGKETQATPYDQTNQRMNFTGIEGQGGFEKIEALSQSQKIKQNHSMNTCIQKLKLLETSFRWRDIQKTLRWLNHILAPNQTKPKLCIREENLEQKSKYQRHDFDLFPIKSNFNYKEEKTTKSHHKKYIKKRKFRVSKNRPKKKRNKKEQHFHSKKNKFWKSSYLNNAHKVNNTIFKPNSDLFDVERLYLKGKNDNSKSHECKTFFVKILKTCGEVNKKPKEKTIQSQPIKTWFIISKLREKNKSKLPKQKPWPHFVYHRVSSSVLHPGLAGQKHKQSAYIAISVVTDNNAETSDKKITKF